MSYPHFHLTLIMVDLAEIGIFLQTIGMLSAATAAVIGVRSYINSNKRSEEARKRELETRQAQLFMSIYQTLYSSEFTQAEFHLFKVKMKSAADLERIMKENVEEYRAWNMYGTFYEGLGLLVKENLIDVGLPAKLMSGGILQFWNSYRDAAIDCRKVWNWPRVLIEAEYLAEAVTRYGVEHPELGIVAPKVGYVESVRT
jgi:hypothetical protein